jgi:formiminoglutamase
MKTAFFKDLKVDYTAGNQKDWTGRNSKIENQYWHQEIIALDIDELKKETNANIGLNG